MKIRSIKIIFAVFAVAAVMLACGTSSEAPDNPPEENVESADPVQPAEVEDIPSSSGGKSPSDPVPFGSAFVEDDMAFVILGTIRPATEIVMNGDQFNTPAEEGEEYIFVEMQVSCRKPSSEQCQFSMRGISAVGSYGEERFIEIFLNGVDVLLESADFKGGASVAGYIPFIIPTDETDLILINESVFGEEFYLATE